MLKAPVLHPPDAADRSEPDAVFVSRFSFSEDTDGQPASGASTSASGMADADDAASDEGRSKGVRSEAGGSGVLICGACVCGACATEELFAAEGAGDVLTEASEATDGDSGCDGEGESSCMMLFEAGRKYFVRRSGHHHDRLFVTAHVRRALRPTIGTNRVATSAETRLRRLRGCARAGWSRPGE
ncbi:MAG: hypothetical protein JWN98_2182 [Abditibacteriota bacterium]|nr:hypothetical protein [Abditibacteriota bacterium]